MGLMRHVGNDSRRAGEREALRGKEVDQRQHTALRQHREREQQQHRGEQVDQLSREGQVAHQLPRSRLTSIPSTASRKAVPRNSGARKMRIFADNVSISARTNPPMASLPISTGVATRIASQSSLALAMPYGKKSDRPMHQQLNRLNGEAHSISARWRDERA